ncbi:hypothetical protein NQ830_12510 [Clostridioides difficile]|nr:hypothetical protein [Clostridioides difficile]WMU95253.1 hypothetical protein ADOKEBJH_00157 [Clostridioides phage AR1086-1]EQE22712.1 hypothetical protein QAW_1123 [Clostridioides difficile CD17]EQG33659.1 hypothetical protein QIM_2996 [Clostridioides difficile DA00128]EQJ06276.1 hypothetical protein QQW_4032 [Clostridioides difficile P8]EQJ49092.1 hypothetical protein QSG_1012 [Clostridioides difficile P25]
MIRYIKDINNISLEDAKELSEKGVYFIIKDGKIKGIKFENIKNI